MSTLTDEYILYLIKQYYEKPKANAEIKNLLLDWQNISDFVAEFGFNFDIDNATGSVLDLIGKIVNLPRQVSSVTPITYFGFSINPNAKGFGSISDPNRDGAQFYRTGQATRTPYQLQDPEYRRFLKIKIAKNTCSPYLVSSEKTSLQQVVFDSFDGRAYVTDNKDNTLTIYISPIIDDTELQLILNLGILPRPITFSYVIIKAEPGETFGFSNNPNALSFSSIQEESTLLPIGQAVLGQPDTTISPEYIGGAFARIYNG